MKSSLEKSAAVLLVAYGLLAISNYALTLTVGRYLGAAALGTFVLANAWSRIFYSATELGASAHTVREISRAASRARSLGDLFVGLRIALLPCGVALLVGIATVYSSRNVSVFALVGTAVGCGSLYLVFEAILLGFGQKHTAALATIVSALILLGGCTAWRVSESDINGFATMYLIASLLSLLVCASFVWYRLNIPTRPVFRFHLLTNELKTSWRIGMSSLLSMAALRTPVLVLSIFADHDQVGAFAAMDMFVTASTIIQTAVTNASFVDLSAEYQRDLVQFRRILRRSNIVLVAAGIATSLFLIAFGEAIMRWFFPEHSYMVAARLLPLAGISAPCLMLLQHHIMVFASANREAAHLRLMLMVLATIAFFQFALVPHYGLVGATWGMLAARVVALILLFVALRRAGMSMVPSSQPVASSEAANPPSASERST